MVGYLAPPPPDAVSHPLQITSIRTGRILNPPPPSPQMPPLRSPASCERRVSTSSGSTIYTPQISRIRRYSSAAALRMVLKPQIQTRWRKFKLVASSFGSRGFLLPRPLASKTNSALPCHVIAPRAEAASGRRRPAAPREPTSSQYSFPSHT